MRKILRVVLPTLLLAAAFQLDVVTGSEISSSLFYIVPVAVAAWLLGRAAGLAFAVAGALAWFEAAHLVGTRFSSPRILYWNVTAEAIVYLVTAWVVSRVHADRERQRRLTAEVIASREVLDREALAVGRLQRDLLPRALPELDGFEWELVYATSTRAGGDYYDALALPDGRVAMIVADATGHGAPAAVLMAMGRALFRVRLAAPGTVPATMRWLNQRLGDQLPDGWFLTACLLVLDPATGDFEYSLAGHCPPLVVRGGSGRVEELPDSGGPPLGPFTGSEFESARGRLEEGDTLVLYTDGITEAMGPTGEMFGTDGLRLSLAGAAETPLAPVRARLLAAARAHVAAASFEDDVTVLLLRRRVSAARPAETLVAGIR